MEMIHKRLLKCLTHRNQISSYRCLAHKCNRKKKRSQSSRQSKL